MTVQISDRICFDGEEFSIIGVKGDFFTPRQFGMEPEKIHTACYRGFFATYELTDEFLLLRKLTIKEKQGNYQAISGVEPQIGEHVAIYSGLAEVVFFKGQLTLAKDFISEYSTHTIGYQPPRAFKTVLEITFEDGRVIEIKDRSKEMNQKRGSFLDQLLFKWTCRLR